MNYEDVKVAFYLKVNESNSASRCPVMGRLTVGRSECVFSAKMLAPRSLWTSGRMKGKSAEAVEINRRLDELRASALAIYREQSAIRERVTAKEVKCLLLGMAAGQETLLDYFRSYIERFGQRVGVNRAAKSARTYRNAYEHVARFLSERLRLSDVPFSALDRSFVDKFDLYLRTERRLAPNTIVLYMSRLHTVINKAIAAGIITADPFAGYEPPRPERRRRYLTRKELRRLMTTPLPSSRLYLVRDLFLFSCYTGISYGDMCRLTAANLETAEGGNTWIKATREKTNVEFEIPLLDLPLHIIDKYRDTAPDGKLLPMYGNSELNKGLKQLAAACGIEQRLVFHQARHNFGTHITLSLGVPIETVSCMMGHRRLVTTQIYAHVTDRKVDEDTKQLRKLSASRKFELYEEPKAEQTND
ncbi:site-specific integrase [uncultured Parabacteroides sp.]|uniref:site-specific integrase n=1 Tax=uncultured Parabacteroides sp. TaxID=512312 RepID=UPI0026216C3F|nr:site-specific integrase [uncultured Parabacteroides sp.]